ncbi:hypothetical protein ACJA3J_06045 [Halobacillus sp. SY10]|uniref:Transporter n=2 Tax=Halobacillus TaxID=45667 RepID=A0A1H0R588_HALAD|nr:MULTISPECIES: hypothetical protein [Halobacillus]RDY70211.1 hypothetical protein DXT76_14005 [Halobacillus trueperi]SDP24600.1 hypothetical protein SAMN05421677_11476 [Halobacillus aidingensis]
MHRQFGFPFGQIFGFPNQGGQFGPGQPPPGPPPGGPPFGGGQGQPPFGGGPGGPGGPGIQLPPPPDQPPSSQGASLFAVDPGSLYGCLYRYTWITLVNGRSFWFYPTFIGRTSVAGYRWQRRRRQWVYTGFDTRQISSFQCR